MELSVSFLPTKDDFADYRVALARAAAGRREVLALRVAGFLLVVAGVLFWAFWGRGFAQTAADMLLVLLGLVVGFYHDAFQPYFVRRHAYFYFDAHREKMIAHTFTFQEDKVQIQSDCYTAGLPYNILYKAYEDGKVWVLYMGRDEIRFLPKRALPEGTNEQIEAAFAAHLTEIKQQEGAREWTRK